MSSRVEELLAAAIDGSGTDGLDPPQSRNEKLLFALNDKLDNVKSALAGKVDGPADGQAYQQLVTDADGNAKWEDRLAYEYTEWKDFTLYYDTAGIEITGFTMPPVGDTVTVKVDGVESVETVTFLKVDDYRYIRYIGRSPLEIEQGAPGWSIAYYSEREQMLGIAKVPTIVSLLVTEQHNIDQKYIPKEVYFVKFDGNSLDKTFDEITEAYNAGLLIILEASGNHGFLKYIDPEELGFLIPNGNVSAMLYLRANNTIDREIFRYLTADNNGTLNNSLILPSSTSGSSKKFKITVGDSGNLSTTDDDGNVVTTSSASWCITPQMFGAVGDGVADDTAAIQAAIDYAFGSGSMRVYVPAGKYKITSPLLLTTSTDASVDGQRWWDGHGVEIFGDSRSTSIIVKSGTGTYTEPSSVTHETSAETAFMQDSPIDSVIILSGLGTGVKIRNLYIKNESTASPSYGIYGSRSRTTIEHINVNTKSRGINLYSFFNRLSDIRYNCAEKALIIGQGTSSTIEQMFVSSCANPYEINSSYTNVNNMAADGCTGTIYDLSGLGLVLNACGSESPDCDYYLKVGGNSAITVNGFCAYRQASADHSVLRFDGPASVLLNHLNLLDNVQLSDMQGLVSVGSEVAIDLSIHGFKPYQASGIDNAAYTRVFKTLPNTGSRISLEMSGLSGCYAVNSDFSLTPYDGVARAARKYTADMVKAIDPSTTIPTEFIYAGMQGFDASKKLPAWYDGSSWFYAAVLPVKPADTSFIDQADGEYVSAPDFTNLLSTSDADYAEDYRFTSSGSLASDTAYWVSGYIAVPTNGVVRVRYADLANAPALDTSSGNVWARPVLVPYNSSKAINGDPVYESSGKITVDSDHLGFSYTSTLSGTAYVRISGRGSANATICTVNEEIAYKQVWQGDPMKLNESVKVYGSNVIVVSPNGTKYKLSVSDDGTLSTVAYTEE